ncbi:hypothetical protein K439DRAFT_658565 [Ramaria rubella]|nr:hypothetical protein K439DRAFT_658565 [Ramaria rubella]
MKQCFFAVLAGKGLSTESLTCVIIQNPGLYHQYPGHSGRHPANSPFQFKHRNVCPWYFLLWSFFGPLRKQIRTCSRIP